MADTNKAEEIADIFSQMADLYLLGGEPNDRYRVASYQRVAQNLRGFYGDLEQMDKEGTVGEISGVGKAIEEKIHEYLSTGKIKTHVELKKRFPKALIDLLNVPSLGPKKVHALWKELGVVNKTSLKKVLKNGTVAALPGFGEKSVENILQGLGLADVVNKRKPYKDMVPVAKMVRKHLEKTKLADRLEVAGSFRRQEETIGDIDFLATSKNPAELIHAFVKHPKTTKVLAEGDTKGSIILEGGQQVDLRVVEADQWGAALQYFTGSKDHNVKLRSLARTKGLTVNEYGVFKLDKNNKKGEKLAGTTEEEVYAALGFHCPDPTLRKGVGEIKALSSS